MKQNSIIYLTSGILSIILLVYLIINLDWSVLRGAFTNIHWGWLIIAPLVYLFNICLRAVRFSTLIYSRKTTWLELIPVSALHNILMYLMPAKTGDIAYIFLAKDRLNIAIPEGTATLVTARFYDFLVIASLLALILPFTGDQIPGWIYLSSIIFCGIVLVAALVVFVVLKIKKTTSFLSSVQVSKNKRYAKILSAIKRFLEGLREIQDHGDHSRTFILTLGIWICIYLNFYSATRGIGLPVSLYHTVLISIVMIPLTLLPLQGFANIGTHEVGWTSVLVAFNFPYETALAIAAGSHLILLISVLTSGMIALFSTQIILKAIKRRDYHELNP